MKISCLTSARLLAGALCGSAFLFLPSHAFSDTCDPVVTGAELSFTDTNCWYQLQDITTPDYNMCQGNGGSDSMNACPSLTIGHDYRVKKVDTSGGGWTPLSPDFPFTPSAPSCADPTLTSDGGIAFTDTNCWYQVQDLTAENWEFCKGYTADISCPAFTAGNDYQVNKVYVTGGVWINDNPPFPFPFTAEASSTEVATIEPEPTTPTTTADLPTPSAESCADPTLTSVGGIAFTDTNCWYQVQDLTAENWEFCKGYTADISCPAFTAGNDYRVNKVYVTGGVWINDDPSFLFTAEVPSTEVTTTEPEPTVPSTATADLPRNENARFTRREGNPFSEDASARGPNGITYDPNNTPANDEDLTVFLSDSGPDTGTEITEANDASQGIGNFRISCQWSHFAYDDPIVAPDSTGGSHLHMYFGKTNANASTYNADDMIRDGGGSCNGFSLNRSAYWMPALLTDTTMTTAVVPEEIIVYYKTTLICPNGKKSGGRDDNGYFCVDNADDNLPPYSRSDSDAVEPVFDPDDTYKLPQGLRLIAGNPSEDTLDITQNNTNDQAIHWSCGENGHTFKEHYLATRDWEPRDAAGFVIDGNGDRKTRKILYDHIPNREDCRYDNSTSSLNKNPQRNNATHDEQSEVFAPLAANIYFQQCLHDRNNVFTAAGSADLMAHVGRKPDWVACDPDEDGISDNNERAERMPRLGFLIYWDLNNGDESDTENWILSSDMTMVDGNHVRRSTLAGSSLHADWLGGWHEDVQKTWLDECLKVGKNCTFGQTGSQYGLGNLTDDADTPLGAGQFRPLVYNGHEAGNTYGNTAGSFYVSIPHRSMDGTTSMGGSETTAPEPAPEPEPTSAGVTVAGNVISWPDNDDYYQIESRRGNRIWCQTPDSDGETRVHPDATTVSSSSCAVSSGRYKVLNMAISWRDEGHRIDVTVP